MPPNWFLPLNPHTPVTEIAHAPLEAKASAFLEPSVIHRGTWGLPSIFWQRGGQSSRFDEPAGDSYLTGLSRLLVRGWSGRNWNPASLPSTDQSGMRIPGARCWADVNPSFSSSDFPRMLRYPLSLITSGADAASLAKMTIMVAQELRNSLGKDGINHVAPYSQLTMSLN